MKNCINCGAPKVGVCCDYCGAGIESHILDVPEGYEPENTRWELLADGTCEVTVTYRKGIATA